MCHAVISVHRRLRQEDYEIKASLDFTVNLKAAKVT